VEKRSKRATQKSPLHLLKPLPLGLRPELILAVNFTVSNKAANSLTTLFKTAKPQPILNFQNTFPLLNPPTFTDELRRGGELRKPAQLSAKPVFPLQL
jgi:hypothetical protein